MCDFGLDRMNFLTLAFCRFSSEAASSSTSILRLCFSLSSLALVLCRASHCSLSSAMASPCRFLRDIASASDWTQVSSRSRLRRCSSASRFLFTSFCKSHTGWLVDGTLGLANVLKHPEERIYVFISWSYHRHVSSVWRECQHVLIY